MIARAILAAWYYAHPGCYLACSAANATDCEPKTIHAECLPPCVDWDKRGNIWFCKKNDPAWRNPMGNRRGAQ